MDRTHVATLVFWIVPLAVCAGLVVTCQVSRRAREAARLEKEGEKQSHRQKEEAEKTRVAELTVRHGAKADWADSLGKEDYFDRVFGLEVQEAVAACGDSPVLFFTELLDVFRKDTTYYIVCGGVNQRPYDDSPSIKFVLEVDRKTAEEMLAAKRQHRDAFELFYAIVARLTDATTRYQRELYAEPYLDEPSIEESKLHSEVWVQGKCLSAVFLETYESWKD